MDELRMFLAAATGAVIGVVVVVALAWTLRVLSESAAVRDQPVPATGVTPAPRRAWRLHWSVGAMIIALSIAAYGFLGYSNRSADKDTQSSDVDANQAAFVPPLSAQFDVGGVALRFDPPVGYCLYPAPLMQSVIVQQGKVNPDNVVHTAFGNCAQLRATAETQARIQDFGMLMTPKPQLEQAIGKAELDQIVASVGDPSTVKETLDQRLRQAQSRLTLQSFSTLGVMQRDDGATYFAYLFKTSADDGGGYMQACVMALTAVKGRLIAYYVYSDYTRDARGTLMTLLQKARAGVGGFIAQNG
jgi:hypothetical protein